MGAVAGALLVSMLLRAAAGPEPECSKRRRDQPQCMAPNQHVYQCRAHAEYEIEREYGSDAGLAAVAKRCCHPVRFDRAKTPIMGGVPSDEKVMLFPRSLLELAWAIRESVPRRDLEYNFIGRVLTFTNWNARRSTLEFAKKHFKGHTSHFQLTDRQLWLSHEVRRRARVRYRGAPLN